MLRLEMEALAAEQKAQLQAVSCARVVVELLLSLRLLGMHSCLCVCPIAPANPTLFTE